jgi:haloacid dehalogenase-like hydrolase
MSGQAQDLVFLFDVDNTLIDNDRVQRDLRAHLAQCYSAEARDRYWSLFEELRNELGYADYLGALERYRIEHMHDPRILRLANWLADYPFRGRLYPGALAAVRHARNLGTPVILSDGDAVFQPRKIERSGLWRRFDSRVLVYIHKENELDDVERWFPARHYVLIDDKLRILDTVKRIWMERVTTIFVRQGHYAQDREINARYGPPDIAIERIGDLRQHGHSAFTVSAAHGQQ